MKNLRINLCLALCFSFYFANAQQIMSLKESLGLPLRSRTYEELKGNPYYMDGFSKAIVKQVNGKTFSDVMVRYDQLEDQLTFKGSDNVELAFAVPVVEFKLTSPSGSTHLFRNGFSPMRAITEKSYFEVLHDGNVKLLKRNAKEIQVTRAYNSAVDVKTVTDHIKYYYAIDNKLHELKRDVKGLDEIFGAKAELVTKYIKENKLGMKAETDIIKIFEYYSSL